jgi:Tol biopolymer transport system component
MTLWRRLSFPTVVSAMAALAGLAAGGQSAYATYPGASNGRLAFAVRGADSNVNIYSVLPNGNDFRRLTTSPWDACAAYSPDGQEIAFCSSRTGAFEIWKMQQNGAKQQQVTHVGGFLIFPDFSPDAATIAFTGTRPGDSVDHIFVISADGSGPLTALTSEADGNNDYPAFSPDGTRIAFISDRPGPCDASRTPQVWTMNVDGSSPKQLTCDPSEKGQLPDWSPDGTKLAYASGPSSVGRIFTMNRPTAGRSRSFATSAMAIARST